MGSGFASGAGSGRQPRGAGVQAVPRRWQQPQQTHKLWWHSSPWLSSPWLGDSPFQPILQFVTHRLPGPALDPWVGHLAIARAAPYLQRHLFGPDIQLLCGPRSRLVPCCMKQEMGKKREEWNPSVQGSSGSAPKPTLPYHTPPDPAQRAHGVMTGDTERIMLTTARAAPPVQDPAKSQQDLGSNTSKDIAPLQAPSRACIFAGSTRVNWRPQL